MGRKGSWLSAVKKAFSPESKEKKSQKSSKSNKKWFGKEKSTGPSATPSEAAPLPIHFPPPPQEEVILNSVEEEEEQNEQNKRAYSVAVATAAAAEAAAAAAQAAAEVVRLTSVTQFGGRSKEEVAAIKIQTAFRGHMARRALRALRGLVRLKTYVEGSIVKRQTANALRSMQSVGRVQSQIQSRRIRMSEENQALQRQLLQKRAKELATLKIGEEWDTSLQSKEQIESSLLSKFEAAMRRERALAYSFSHQQTWKKSARSSTLMFMDPNNPHWGWSWMERFMAARPWETHPDKQELQPEKNPPSTKLPSPGGERNNKNPSPTQKPTQKLVRGSPATPKGRRKPNPLSPMARSVFTPDDDTKSVYSLASERNRRHSIAGGSSIRDDESLASSPSVPGYMAPTRSAKAKARGESPLGPESGPIPGKEAGGIVKKRLSFAGSPARARRHSGPPRVDISVVSGSVSGQSERNGDVGI